MNEAVDALFNFYESTERHDPYYLTVDHVAHRILFRSKLPRLTLELLVAYGNLFVLFVYFENEELICLTDLEHVGNCRNGRPGKVGDVRETVETVHGNKGAEIGHSFNLAFNNVVLVDVSKELLFLCSLCGFAGIALFLKDHALGGDYLLPPAVLLYLDEAQP